MGRAAERASATAVAAVRVAELTSHSSFVEAEREHRARVAASHRKQSALTPDKLGGLHPGATRLSPGKG